MSFRDNEKHLKSPMKMYSNFKNMQMKLFRHYKLIYAKNRTVYLTAS